MSLSVALTAIGAVASIASAVLVVLTYLWSRVPSSIEAETWLENRMVGTIFQGYTGEFEVLEVRVFEANGVSAYIARYLKLSPKGKTAVLGDVKGSSDGVWWETEDFEAYCEEFGVEAEYETFDGHETVRVEIELATMDRKTVYRFIDHLTSLKTE